MPYVELAKTHAAGSMLKTDSHTWNSWLTTKRPRAIFSWTITLNFHAALQHGFSGAYQQSLTERKIPEA
jgi:hypothetical protein